MAEVGPREMPERKKGRLKTRPPGTALSFIPRAAWWEEVDSHLDTNRETKALSSPPGPSLPAWQHRTHSSQLAACSGSPEPKNTEPSCGGWRKGAKAPPPAPARAGLASTHTYPGPTAGPRHCAYRGGHRSHSWGSSGGWCSAPSPAVAKATPQAEEAMTKGSKGESKAAWRTPRAPRCSSRTSGLTLCTPLLNFLVPLRESPGLGTRQVPTKPSSVVLWPRL